MRHVVSPSPIREELEADSSRRSMRSRKSFILAGAFGTLVLVIAVSGALAWRNGTQLLHQVASVHATHKKAGDALQTIRENVYLVSILTRDYLMDPEPANIPSYVDQFEAIRVQTEGSFSDLRATGLDTSSVRR